VDAWIEPPRRMPLIFGPALWIVRRRTGRDVLLARLLTWYPRAAVGSGVMESLIAKSVGRVDERMLKLVRMTVSFTVECPFCMGFNSEGWELLMNDDELAVVQGRLAVDAVASLSPAERVAIEYARCGSATPIAYPAGFDAILGQHFDQRELVVLATTVAQVNYWARVAQGLGTPSLA